MARLNVPELTPLRRSARNAKLAQPDDDDLMSFENEPQSSPTKGKTNKSMLPPPTPVPGARTTTPAKGTRLIRAQSRALSVVPKDMPAEDAEMDEEDALKTITKAKPAPKKPAVTRKTRGQARAESEMAQPMMAISVHVEGADMNEDDAPKVIAKPKVAAKKPKTIRKTRGQNLLHQIAETVTREEEFFDAEEEPVSKIKTEDVESGVEEEIVQEAIQPVKKRGRPAKKVPVPVLDDDLMIVEEGIF